MSLHQDNSCRRRCAMLTALFLLAVMVRWFRAWQEPVVNPDAIRFIEQAQAIPLHPVAALRQEVYHPLHSLAGLAVHSVIHGLFRNDRAAWLASMQTVGVLAGALVAIEILLLARRFGAPFWAAAAAAMVWIVGRRTSAYGADGLSDMLFLALFAAAVLAGIAGLRFRRRRLARRQALSLFGAGLFSGLAYLTRPEGLAAGLILLIVLALMALVGRQNAHARSAGMTLLRRKRISLLAASAGTICILLGMAIPAVPYMVIIGGLTGKKAVVASAETSLPPFGVQSHGVQSHGVQPSGWPQDRLKPVRHTTMATLRTMPPPRPTLAIAGPPIAGPKAPPSFVHCLLKIIKELWETFGFAPWLVLGFAVLLKPRPWGRPRLRLLMLVWSLLWLALMVWLVRRAGYLDGRHTLPLELVLYAHLALAFAFWAAVARRTFDRPRTAAAIAAAVILLAMLPGLIRLAEPPMADRQFIRNAATWVQTHTPADTVVCDNEQLIGYYSGRFYAFWLGTENDPLLWELNIQRTRQHPHVIGAMIFYPKRGDKIRASIGPYQAIHQFHSELATGGDVLVLYALPGDLPSSP